MKKGLMHKRNGGMEEANKQEKMNWYINEYKSSF